MPYEVELKFAGIDPVTVREKCRSLAGTASEHCSQADTYLRHPTRSFEATDEALRVRQADGHLTITYKGPKVDGTTKTRTEVELDLAPGQHTVAGVLDFWQRLGFLPVRTVHKSRETLRVAWQGREVLVSLDQVDGLGDFVELELSAEPEQLEQSRQILKSLADYLGLRDSERRSYLELLLEKDARASDKAKNIEDWTE